jgi:ribosomal protein L23
MRKLLLNRKRNSMLKKRNKAIKLRDCFQSQVKNVSTPTEKPKKTRAKKETQVSINSARTGYKKSWVTNK